MRDGFQKSKRIAVLLHGFAGKKSFMKEIEQRIKETDYEGFYDEIHNLSYYDSKHGLDFSRQYDLRTSIYDSKSKKTLSHHLFELLFSLVENHQSSVSIDIFAHSMGGLVTRAMVKYYIPSNNQKMKISRIFLLGTPNHGTRLAVNILNIPTDILLTGLNIALELPRGRVNFSDYQILKSQFLQMVPKSKFLTMLNNPLTSIERSINWVTVRGLNSSGLLESVWQPFLFRKVRIDGNLPFVHIGMIPNDGIVDAKSVPLKHAINLSISDATHMDLLKWKSKESGIKVHNLLKPIILKHD